MIIKKFDEYILLENKDTQYYLNLLSKLVNILDALNSSKLGIDPLNKKLKGLSLNRETNNGIIPTLFEDFEKVDEKDQWYFGRLFKGEDVYYTKLQNTSPDILETIYNEIIKISGIKKVMRKINK